MLGKFEIYHGYSSYDDDVIVKVVASFKKNHFNK